jgi:hypothetical protein
MGTMFFTSVSGMKTRWLTASVIVSRVVTAQPSLNNVSRFVGTIDQNDRPRLLGASWSQLCFDGRGDCGGQQVTSLLRGQRLPRHQATVCVIPPMMTPTRVVQPMIARPCQNSTRDVLTPALASIVAVNWVGSSSGPSRLTPGTP